MDILKLPNPHLFIPTKEVTVFGTELKTLLDSMWETMIAANGLGLSANQVGLSHSMFVMMGPNNEQFCIVNPKVLSKSQYATSLKEGCLSSPGEFLIIPDRPSWVQLQYQDEKGIVHTKVFHDLFSVCVTHEMEHLEGKSFLMSPSINKAKRKELYKKWNLK